MCGANIKNWTSIKQTGEHLRVRGLRFWRADAQEAKGLAASAVQRRDFAAVKDAQPMQLGNARPQQKTNAKVQGAGRGNNSRKEENQEEASDGID